MACVEYWCNNNDCNFITITNSPELTVCPDCGGTDMGKAFDEDGDHSDYDDYDDEDDYDEDEYNYDSIDDYHQNNYS